MAQAASNAAQVALLLQQQRLERMFLTWRVLTRVWDDYKICPPKLKRAIWQYLLPRFRMTDLATPALMAIVGATYGCQPTRRINKCFNKDEVEKFLKAVNFGGFMQKFFAAGAAFGTSYALPGWDDNDRPVIELIPSMTTRIDTPDDDACSVESISRWRSDGIVLKYYEDGQTESSWHARSEKVVPNSDCGFIPVAIGRGRHLNPSCPYGDELIFAAVDGSVQITYLDCDMMILEKSQAYSTRVVIGNEIDDKKSEGGGPFGSIRLTGDEMSKANAFYINPNTPLEKVDEMIRSKIERVAVQCLLPTSVFIAPKSGVNEGTGSALLKHKPTYDMITTVQSDWGSDGVEREIVARIDALISWRKSGKRQDLQKHLDNLQMETVFNNDAAMALDQGEAQTLDLFLRTGLMLFDDAFLRVNPTASAAKIKEAKAARDKMQAEVKARTEAAAQAKPVPSGA